MPKKINIKNILKKNPKVDKRELEKGFELLENLKKMGLAKKGYKLVSPCERQRVQVNDGIAEDPRTIHLNRF